MKRRLYSIIIVLSLFIGSLTSFNIVSASAMEGSGTASSPYLIKTANDFYSISTNPSAHYKLANDLDFQNTKRNPLPEFKGKLDGNNKTIKNMVIESSSNNIGIFSRLTSAIITDLNMSSIQINTAVGYVGGLAGIATNSTITNCTITNSSLVTKGQVVGGLIGYDTNSKLTYCYANNYIYSTTSYAGGIIGYAYGSTLSQCYSLGSVRGTTMVAGLAGDSYSAVYINDCFSQCSLQATKSSAYTGGLVAYTNAVIKNSYFSGTISSKYTSGLCRVGTVTNSYFDSSKVKLGSPADQIRTTAEMYKELNYVGWDFDKVWIINEGKAYPTLRMKTASNEKIPIKSITLNQKEIIISGKTLQLNPVIAPDNATDKSLSYSSKDTSIATVTSNGLITAVTPGAVQIAVAANDGSKVSTVVDITVVPSEIPVTKVEIKATKTTITVGETLPLNAVITPSNATNSTLSWSSDNTGVATIDANGTVTGVSEGSVTIKVITANGLEDKIAITVKPKSGTPNPNDILEIVLEPKEQMQLSIDEDLAENEEIYWSSSDTDVVTVDSKGKIKAIAVGRITITATNESGSFKEVIHVIVVDCADDYRLAIDLIAGERCRLTFDGNTKTKKVTWTSMDTNIATVTSKGKVKAISKGLTIITAVDEYGYEKVVYVRVR